VVARKRQILFEPKVQLLANYLVTGSQAELLPTPDQRYGVRYLDAERVTGDEPAQVKKWLEELAGGGVLEGRFVSKLVLCPKCGSSQTPVHYCCSYCRSIDIEKKALFEHLACGVIDKEDNFKKGTELICPRCSRKLGELGITHRVAGTWFLCRSCQKPFDRPQSFHVCGVCKHFFVVEDAAMEDVLAYKLSKPAEAELRSGGVFLKPLKDLLEGLGYDVTTAGVLPGTSGTAHRFDLVGTREMKQRKETIVVDVVSSTGGADVSSVTTMFAKRYDTHPDRAVIVAIPAIMENAKKLATMYNITLIEANSAPEAVEKLKAALGPVPTS
jgi:hypothetical protein